MLNGFAPLAAFVPLLVDTTVVPDDAAPSSFQFEGESREKVSGK
jgi:hypothetical protein